MSIEELKDDFIGMVDKAWHALEGTVDVDRARELVHEATTALKTKVEEVAKHLLYHVMNNANPPAQAQAPTETPAAPVETPAPTAPEGTVPDPAEPVTGMAPPAGQPTTDPAPAEAEAPVADGATEQASV